MSGFDFDALRDPEAPQPGARERAGVDARARRLRARTRVNRLALSSISVVAAVAVAFGIVASQRDDGPHITVAGTAPSSIADRFVPPTTVDNGIVTLPVTLPDGETTTLTYPQDLRIAQFGFAGGTGIEWPVETGTLRCCGKEISIRYATIADVYGDATPIKVYRGANGEDVPYFRASQQISSQPNPLNYLVFQFGPWLVQVYDVQQPGDFELPMTDAQRATWARSLTGTPDEHGYLLLHAKAPLSLGHDFDGLFGAPVTGANQLEIASHLYCGGPTADSSAHRRFTQGDGTPGVAWCDGELHVSATGSAAFVDGVDGGLQTSGLTAPPATTTTTSTTTTTTPGNTSSFKAFSASFVSPEHGWALTNGPVEETTDGGRTWRRVGSMGGRFRGRIRFADATHGFAWTDSQLMATTDGGQLWSLLATPFSGVADLAIANGTVYVASYTNSASVEVWTTPLDATQWTRHPSGLAIGAGPIPYTQLVFSEGHGVLLQVDRDVVGGAQLTPDGRWGAWNAPCVGLNGPAYLAASSSRDLVASCSEHNYGGGPLQSSAWFSHDGGNTFERNAAPVAGEITSQSANAAIVVENGVLRRTTDGGHTWTNVATVQGAYHAVDLGFTTPTQGFVTFDNGTMLMTYDAGATWQKVNLP